MYTNFVFIVKQADKRSSVSRLCSTKSPSWRAIDSLGQAKKGFKLELIPLFFFSQGNLLFWQTHTRYVIIFYH